MGVERSHVKLILGGAIVLGGLAFPPFLAGDGIVWGTMLATALASVAAGNTANAIDALTQGKEGDRISLENEDLTKAVGKAIAAVITLAAKQHPGDTRRKLEKIAAQAKDNWVKIAQQELTQQRYPELREAKLDRFLTPEEYSLTQDGNLTPQEWQDIFIRLNMAACKGGGFQIPPEVYPQVADLLHTTFPKALRETLKEDFAKDGKAFAGLTLQLLTGMKAELAQLRNTNLAVNTAELSQILQQFQQLETQLRGTVAQQQAFFRQISQDIDSGFAEVCQQLGVMETNITALLQNLETRLDALDEKLTRLEAQSGGRQLSRQEFKARKYLLEYMRTELAGRKPLHHAILLNLGKEQQPNQVQRPWDDSVKVGEQRSFKLPAETSILEVFENPAINGKFLILGKPGGGKTTTLLELAQALIKRAETDSDAPIPIILELSAWQTVTKRKFPDVWNKEKYDPSIKEWILSQLRSKGVSQEIGEQWIKEKELVLLLDGLDELRSERQAKCVRAINQFLDSEFSPLHLVVCSRKEEYEEYEEVLHLNGAICLEDLTVEQMRHYFASVNLGEFWESIKDSEKIVNFISQPLFLAITSIAYQQIDVEEWRNCNTEQNRIDYLLGIYRVKILPNKLQEPKHHKTKNFLTYQNRLIRLAFCFGQKKEFTVIDFKDFVFSNNYSCRIYFILKLLLISLPCFYFFYLASFFEVGKSTTIPTIIDLLIYQILSIPLDIFYFVGVYILVTLISVFFGLCVILTFLVFAFLPSAIYSALKSIPRNTGYGEAVESAAMILLLILLASSIPFWMPLLPNIFSTFYFVIFVISGWIQDYESSREQFMFWIVNIDVTIKAILYSNIFYFFCEISSKNIAFIKNIQFCFLSQRLLIVSILSCLMYILWSIISVNQIYLLPLASFYLLLGFWLLNFPLYFNHIWSASWYSLDLDTSYERGFVKPMTQIINSVFVSVFLCFFSFVSISILSALLDFRQEIIIIENQFFLSLFSALGIGFSCIQYLALRITLVCCENMPWNITRFLDNCTERLILQRVGNRYRFIHRLVQEHFANLEIQKE